ncbi:MAG: hypothetical protein LUC89_10710 [Oscillospiraceae bacterium]|nr:hypothetical protein [Oscillospiraceae bacterium]
MEDRVIVDFDALDRIAGKLKTACNELESAGKLLSASSLSSAGGAYLRLSGCGASLQTVGGSVSAGTVAQAVTSYRAALNRISAYSSSLASAVSTTASMFRSAESGSSTLNITAVSAESLSGATVLANAISTTDSTELFDYDWKDIVGSFGNIGKIFGIVDKTLEASTWNEWASVGLSIWQTTSKIAKDYSNYTKIGNAIGTQNAMAYFWKKQFGLRSVGYASTASSPTARFYNNLHNTTSPYNLSDAFAPLTGQKGAVATVAAWAGVALTGVTNAYSNIQEQKNSNGTMSTGRVVAETITETALDTVITYGGTAVVGAAITAATGVVAAPVVVAVATGAAIAGINAGAKAVFGKTVTEAVSDFVLDSAVNVGNAISSGAKTVANWFSKLSFT